MLINNKKTLVFKDIPHFLQKNANVSKDGC